MVALLPASAAKQPTTVQVTLLDKDTWGTFSAIFVATKHGVFFKRDLGIFPDWFEETKTGFLSWEVGPSPSMIVVTREKWKVQPK